MISAESDMDAKCHVCMPNYVQSQMKDRGHTQNGCIFSSSVPE
jgi:hypothetical protein